MKKNQTASHNHPLFTAITAYIATHNLIKPGSTIILGLSGGPDSVFLAHVLAPLHHTKTINLIAAHLDHQWRPESGNEANFCRTLSENLDISFATSTINDLDLSLKFNGSQEEMGRKARRTFFEKLSREHNASTIALAHHRDDQLETFFIRLIRGASLTGLTGMQPKQGLYIRPLLNISKAAILDYLTMHSIDYLTDPSNTSDHYLRNRIRHQLMPALQRCDSRGAATMLRTLEQLQATENFVSTIAQKTFQELSIVTDQNHGLNLTHFLALDTVLQQRILILWLCTVHVPFTPSQALLDEIVRFFKAGKSNRHHIHAQWCLVKKKMVVFIEKQPKN